MDILTFIATHWVDWLFTAILAVLGYIVNLLRAQLAEERKKNEAIAEGVQSLLRESIVSNYIHCLEKGFCPIYAKESVKRAYKAYHDGLGGNDVASELYKKLLEMPESPKGGSPDAKI